MGRLLDEINEIEALTNKYKFSAEEVFILHILKCVEYHNVTYNEVLQEFIKQKGIKAE